MKALVVFYSRTGTTKKVAETIAKSLKCDIEELIDLKNRKGILGFFSGGRDAAARNLTCIAQPKKDQRSYDITILGTPIWAWNMCPAIRTYITKYKNNLKKVAFFCTMDGSGGKNAFKEMAGLCKKKPIGAVELRKKEVVKEKNIPMIKDFIKAIRK